MSDYTFLSLTQANDEKHKYVATFKNNKTNRNKSVKFGAYGMGDFIYYNEKEGIEVAKKKKKAYIARHIALNEDYNNPLTKGWWSMNLLWSRPTFQTSYEYVLRLLKKQGYL